LRYPVIGDRASAIASVAGKVAQKTDSFHMVVVLKGSCMMEESVLSPLARWENFYVIVGSSAGALTGLQFVVITLIAEAGAASSTSVRAFGTPTVVDFCVTLLISAIVSAPWHRLSAPAVLLIACGIWGVLYTLRAVYHARRQTEYKPDFGDWTW
jgi:hypothetical protein